MEIWALGNIAPERCCKFWDRGDSQLTNKPLFVKVGAVAPELLAFSIDMMETS